MNCDHELESRLHDVVDDYDNLRSLLLSLSDILLGKADHCASYHLPGADFNAQIYREQAGRILQAAMRETE